MKLEPNSCISLEGVGCSGCSQGDVQPQLTTQLAEAKRSKEYRPRMQRKPSSTSQDSDANVANVDGKSPDVVKTGEPVLNFGAKQYHHFQDGVVEIREARVSTVAGSNLAPKASPEESVEKYDGSCKTSPTKSTTSEVKTSSLFEFMSSASPEDHLTHSEASEDLKESVELKQFEALERELGAVSESDFRYLINA